MFTFILTVCLTAAWSLLYYSTVRHERKRYDDLYKQTIKLLGVQEDENNKLEAEIRRLREENQRLRETYQANGMMILKEAAE